MEPGQIKLSLLQAADDPHQFSDEDQAELFKIQDDLRKRGIRATGIAFHPAGDTHLGQFLITLGQSGVLAALAGVAGAWLQGRYGRKVRLKFGDVEAEARTPDEIEQLLERLACFQNEATQRASHSEHPSTKNPLL